jgi:hypothetical protein
MKGMVCDMEEEINKEEEDDAWKKGANLWFAMWKKESPFVFVCVFAFVSLCLGTRLLVFILSYIFILIKKI